MASFEQEMSDAFAGIGSGADPPNMSRRFRYASSWTITTPSRTLTRCSRPR